MHSDLPAFLHALKSTEQNNEFILARSRGGLVSTSHHLLTIVEEADVCFRKKFLCEGELVLRNTPTDVEMSLP